MNRTELANAIKAERRKNPVQFIGVEYHGRRGLIAARNRFAVANATARLRANAMFDGTR